VLGGDCGISEVGILIGPAQLSFHVNKLNWIILNWIFVAVAVVTANAVAVVNFFFCFVFIGAVPKKESDEQPQHKEHQQQSKSSASDKEFNKEHLEAVKRYYLICCISQFSNSYKGLSVIVTNKLQIPKKVNSGFILFPVVWHLFPACTE